MTTTVIPAIDSKGWAKRIVRLYPGPWTGSAAKCPGGVQYSLAEAIGVELERTIGNVEYSFLASRISTAIDTALDACCADYCSATLGFPFNIKRTPGEPDPSLRQRLLVNLLPPAVTRQALINAITKLVGQEPRFIEPARFADNGMLDGWTYLDIDTVQNPSRLADPSLAWQGFIESALPPYNGNQGTAPIYALDQGFCLDSPSGYLIDPEATWWQQAASLDQLINKLKAEGTTVWRRYTEYPLTTAILGGTVLVSSGQKSSSITVFPPFAGSYIVLASANWNTGISWIANANNQFTLSFSTPSPGNQTVDWIAIPITSPQALLLGITSGAISMDVGIPASFQELNYTLIAAASWNTNIWLSSQTSSLATLKFSVPSPPQGSLSIYYFDPQHSGAVSIPASSLEMNISVPSVNGNYQAFAMPNWDTGCEIVKYPDAITVIFNTPAPAGAMLTWGMHSGS